MTPNGRGDRRLRRPVAPCAVTRFAARGLVALALAAGAACAPRAGIVLPDAVTGEPSGDVVLQANAARGACSAVSSFSAEIAVSGRISGDRVRGRLLVGIAGGGRLRLEALAPFGQPVFVLVATGGSATLLLPRDRRIVSEVPPDELLEALTGMRLDGSDLGALLTGCVVPGDDVSAGFRLADGWSSAGLANGRATAYLRARKGDAFPRVLAARLDPVGPGSDAITVGYDQYAADGLPRSLRLERTSPGAPLALGLTLSQVDVTSALDSHVFEVIAPPDSVPMSLEDVRREGPLRVRE